MSSMDTLFESGLRRFADTSIIVAVLVASLAFGAAKSAGAVFEDKTAELDLELGNSAAAWADYDNDGWVDLCAGGVLWRNDSGKAFKRVANLGAGVFGDFDNDGFADYLSWSQRALHRNVNGERFESIAIEAMSDCSSRGGGCGDFNGDGFLDVYIGGYEDWGKGITYPDMILLNREGKTLEKSWWETRYRARGVTCCDFDMDGDIDVYVSNYRLQPNLLWRNDGTGKFTEEAQSLNAVATWKGFAGGHSIGAAWGDFDGDGLFDLFAGNFAHDDSRGHQPHSFFLRNSGPEDDYKFENKGQCGILYQESYASPAAGDYDNDGDLDLFFTTVYGTASFGKKNHPVLYRNDGDWKFADVTAEAGLAELPPTYQAAWADFDNDGDLDLATGGRLFVNRGNSNNWLKVRLTGDGNTVNQNAIGSIVQIRLEETVLIRQVEAGTGEGNQNEMTLHFGLGDWEAKVNPEIRWAGVSSRRIDGIRPNSLITLSFDSKKSPEKISQK